jgi:hypothetical protein
VTENPRRIRNMIGAWLDAAEAALDAWAADLRLSITAREAASVDWFNNQLRAVTVSEAEREEARRAAIVVAQMGVSADDVEHAIAAYYARRDA